MSRFPTLHGRLTEEVAGLEAAPFPGTPGKTEPLDSSKDPQDAISIPNELATFEPQAEDDGVYRPEAASSPEDRPGSHEPSTRALSIPRREGSSPGEPGEVLPSDAQTAKEESDESVTELEDAVKNGIVISSEMEAVMQTLTAQRAGCNDDTDRSWGQNDPGGDSIRDSHA